MNRVDISYRELLERYAAGERDFSNCRLSGDNEIIGANLEGIILVNADLAEHDLSRTNLCRANLSGAGLEQALFNDANLTGAYLINASKIEFASFCQANLTNAILHNGMNEREPFILRDAIFYNTIMPDGSIRNEVIS